MNDNTYLEIAELIAKQSKATKLKVGAVIVKDSNIISFSYNGTPPGTCNICENEHNKTYPKVIHAESMAITKVAASNNSTLNSVMYITHAPCIDCSKLIYQSGIKTVVFREPYKNNEGIDFLINQGVNVYYLPLWNSDVSPALKDTQGELWIQQ